MGNASYYFEDRLIGGLPGSVGLLGFIELLEFIGLIEFIELLELMESFTYRLPNPINPTNSTDSINLAKLPPVRILG